jgi:hypothetical protein
MFHRQDMHAMLMDVAVGKEGKGNPARLVVNHKVGSTFTSTRLAPTNFCDSAPVLISKLGELHLKTAILQPTKQSSELMESALPSEL